jgi:hypothetical protein
MHHYKKIVAVPARGFKAGMGGGGEEEREGE